MDNPFVQDPEKKEKPTPKETEAPVVTQPPVQITQAPVEKVEPAVADAVTKKEEEIEIPETGTPKDEDGDDLLIENDGNVFWIFQKVVWNFLKMALIVGLLGLLIWIIWRPMNNPLNKIHNPINKESVQREEKKESPQKKVEKKKEKKVEKKEKSQKEVVIPETPTVSALSENYAYKIALWADWMEQTRQAHNDKVLSRSLYWARRVEAYYHLTTTDLLPTEVPAEREKRIDVALADLKMLIEEAKGLLTTLDNELSDSSIKSRTSEKGMLEADRALKDSIETLNGDQAEKLLAEKTRLYEDFVAQNSKIMAYHYVYNLVQSQFPVVQDIHDNLLSNRDVLINNVRVVGFPGDQFHRILTPAEWQNIK
jgi:hypothetical protein